MGVARSGLQMMAAATQRSVFLEANISSLTVCRYKRYLSSTNYPKVLRPGPASLGQPLTKVFVTTIHRAVGASGSRLWIMPALSLGTILRVPAATLCTHRLGNS